MTQTLRKANRLRKGHQIVHHITGETETVVENRQDNPGFRYIVTDKGAHTYRSEAGVEVIA